MSESVFSASWYRVAALKPRLRRHAHLHRHSYRHQVWYVLEDSLTGHCHRLSVAAYRAIAQMDGRRSVQQIWDEISETSDDEAPTQDELIRLLGQLHTADVLTTDVVPDTDEIAHRRDKQRRRRLRQRLMSPLAIRIPVFDPDAFLTHLLPLVRPAFSSVGLVLWLALVVTAGLLAASHWSELTGNLADRVLTPQNLLILWLAYPLVKVLHELGHGFAAKAWGADVHEIGIMLLVLLPVPYVEASAASALREKSHRMVVGAAGIMVELALAALAMLVWLAVEPGAVRTLAWNVMLIGGVSTLLFNGNPLLRYDGYYVLADAIEIPNLATRSNAYLGYLIKRYLFGVREARSPVAAAGEARWFVLYGLTSFTYRLFILFVIILFIGSRFFILGSLLAISALVLQVLLPLLKQIRFLLFEPELHRQRLRALVVSLSLVLVVAVLVGGLPVAARTQAEGVVWVHEHARVRAQTDARILRVPAVDGAWVETGEPLIETVDPWLDLRVRLLQAQREELESRLIAAGYRDRSQVRVVREEISVVEASLALALERQAALIIRSPATGTLILADTTDLPGRYVPRGLVLGYVIPSGETEIRVVVKQNKIGLIRARTEAVQVWLAGRPVQARIARLVPAATDRLPSAALGAAGGGAIATDPSDLTGIATLEPVFELDLSLPSGSNAALPGMRVPVRFDHGREPLAAQWYRALRQLLLAHFAI